jgi:hypothetical protein
MSAEHPGSNPVHFKGIWPGQQDNKRSFSPGLQHIPENFFFFFFFFYVDPVSWLKLVEFTRFKPNIFMSSLGSSDLSY